MCSDPEGVGVCACIMFSIFFYFVVGYFLKTFSVSRGFFLLFLGHRCWYGWSFSDFSVHKDLRENRNVSDNSVRDSGILQDAVDLEDLIFCSPDQQV